MNRFHIYSFIDCVLRNSVSMKSIKTQSMGQGANLVPIAVPHICQKNLKLNSKRFFQHVVCNFYDIFCGYVLMQKLTILFVKNLQTCNMGYTRVDSNHISSNQNCSHCCSPKSHLYFMYNIFLLSLLAANDDLRILKRFL